MVGFRNTVGNAQITNWSAPTAQKIAFGRGMPDTIPFSDRKTLADTDGAGSLGFVAINNEDSEWSATFDTSLPDGSYCDVISGQLSNGGCTGSTYVASLPTKLVLYLFCSGSRCPMAL